MTEPLLLIEVGNMVRLKCYFAFALSTLLLTYSYSFSHLDSFHIIEPFCFKLLSNLVRLKSFVKVCFADKERIQLTNPFLHPIDPTMIYTDCIDW